MIKEWIKSHEKKEVKIPITDLLPKKKGKGDFVVNVTFGNDDIYYFTNTEPEWKKK